MAERSVRAFWPLWTVLALCLAPLMMGWQDSAPLELFWALTVIGVLSILGTLGLGLRRFRWPSRIEAVARVDASLPGRPISALADSQAIGAGDPASEAVWRAHLVRMAERTRAARTVDPDLRVARHDPFGLRYIALLFLVVAVLFGSILRVGSVADMAPGGGTALATGPVWEGWIEPPGYTGKPSLYLADIPPGPLGVPEGSRVTLRLYGDVGALTVAETVSGRTEDIPAASADQQRFDIVQDGVLSIAGPGGASWQVTLLPDASPRVEVLGPAEADAMGQMTMPFGAGDDYGVVAGQAVIALDVEAVTRTFGLTVAPDARDPIVVDLPLPFSGDRTEYEELLIDDFSQHPFANLPVTVTLSVTDAAGQDSTAEPVALNLPGRRFFQPVARAVIEQRRDLLWSQANAARVLQVLRAVSWEPADIFPNETTYLRLNVTLRRLEALSQAGTMTPEEMDEIALALWDLAIQLEDGTLADARERLRRAQERLAEAMRNGASDEEIAELMNEMREAMDDYMRMLAENAEPQDGADQPQTSENSMEITQDELQALMDRIQELMEEGRMAEAAELMDQLNELMENLQVTQGEGGGGPQTPGQQSMQDMAEALRDQQDLSDEAFRDLQEQFNGPQDGQQPGQQPGEQSQGQGRQGDQPQGQSGEGQSPGDQPGSQGDQTGETGQGGDGQQTDPQGTLAERQQALRDELNRQRGNLPAMTGDEAAAARRALERAEGAMDGAEDALRGGNLAEAIDRQAEAMDALREGMRNLGEALAQNERPEEGQGQAQGAAEGRVEPTRRDPLGRQLGNSGQYGTDENLLQDGDVYRRAEELLGEIRRRAAEQERPMPERDYLKRLLDRF